MDDEEKLARFVEIKLGNIRLISDFYLKKLIPVKIIQGCVEFLDTKDDDLSVILLCELIKRIYRKLHTDNKVFLNETTLSLIKRRYLFA